MWRWRRIAFRKAAREAYLEAVFLKATLFFMRRPEVSGHHLGLVDSVSPEEKRGKKDGG